VTEGAEVPGVTVRNFSAGAHSSKAGGSRARTPLTKIRISNLKKALQSTQVSSSIDFDPKQTFPS
jgi:hypothetical protein